MPRTLCNPENTKQARPQILLQLCILSMGLCSLGRSRISDLSSSENLIGSSYTQLSYKGIMEKKTETTIMGFMRVMEKKMETTSNYYKGLYM